MKSSLPLFSTILASTVHDMKNSLGMMLEALEAILEETPKAKSRKEYGVVQYESSRVNSTLMQLLATYKIENEQMPFNPSYHNLYDFIEEQILMHSPLLNAKGFTYSIDVDETVDAIFDESLLSMVVSNIIGNAVRYAHSEIAIIADTSKNVNISICDNGPGYPGPMLEMAGDYLQGVNQSTGSTGLGLFFAQQVAELHQHDNMKGSVKLSNGGLLGGGVFQIILP